MEDTDIQWHPGFVSAMNLELKANREDLIFEKEYNLNIMPLKVDLLIIRKNLNVNIDNEIGKIFKGHNLIEYKNPKDNLNIDTFYKVMGYASLYKSYGKTLDSIKADDVTISLVRDVKPKGLFKYFDEHQYPVSKPYRGIYYINEGVLFPAQIIITEELEWEAHRWLRSLSSKIEKRHMKELLENIRQLSGKYDKELADSVLEVSIRANIQMIEELRGDNDMSQALLEIMEPEINKVSSERAEKAVLANKRNIASNFLKLGKLSYVEIAECSGLPLEEVIGLSQQKSFRP